MPLSIVRDEIPHIASDALLCPLSAKPAFKKKGWLPQPLQEAQVSLPASLTGDQVVYNNPAGLSVRKLICPDLPAYDSENADMSRRTLRHGIILSLRLAHSLKLDSISIPLEAFGRKRHLKPEIYQTIRNAVQDFLLQSDLDIRLVVSPSKKLPFFPPFQQQLDDYIRERLQPPKIRALSGARTRACEETDFCGEQECLMASAPALPPLENWIEQRDEPFSAALLRLIAERGLSEVSVYKRANLDRKLFSKIRSKINYTPKKSTILSLCIALELNLDETADLLSRAGYALSRASVADIIVEYFILHEHYDLLQINETLFFYDQPILGG